MTEYRAIEPNRAPSHPGLLLKEALPALKLSQTKAAKLLGVSRQTLNNVMSGRTAVTPALALKMGKLCGNGPNIWLAMQTKHDLWHTRKAIKRELDKIPAASQLTAG